MGYEVRPQDVDASFVALAPESRARTVAVVDQDVQFGLSAGGALETPATTLAPGPTLPGMTLQGARLHASTDQRFALAIHCTFSVLEIQAGPVDVGGARWNLYRGRERLDRFQPLLHTLLLPEETTRLRLSVQTWVRTPRRLFGLLGGARQWMSPIIHFDVPLE